MTCTCCQFFFRVVGKFTLHEEKISLNSIVKAALASGAMLPPLYYHFILSKGVFNLIIICLYTLLSYLQLNWGSTKSG